MALIGQDIISGPDGTVHSIIDDTLLEWTSIEVRSVTKTNMTISIGGRSLDRVCGPGTTIITFVPPVPLTSVRNWKNVFVLTPTIPYAIGSGGSTRVAIPPEVVVL